MEAKLKLAHWLPACPALAMHQHIMHAYNIFSSHLFIACTAIICDPILKNHTFRHMQNLSIENFRELLKFFLHILI